MTPISSMVAEMQEKLARRAAEHAARVAVLPPGVCEICGGSGELRFSDVRAPRPCPECQKPTAADVPGLPPFEFRDARFSNYTVTDGTRHALEAARSFMISGRDLFISGGVGTGKTRLAASIVNECTDIRVHARFYHVPSVLHELQPSRHPDDAHELERRLFSVPILVLDDLGAERDAATDYTRRTLLLIYEQRSSRGVRTVWTSNKNLQQLSDMADDDRLASRLAGRCDVVRIVGADWRVKRDDRRIRAIAGGKR